MDVIEAGFPIASPGDFESVQAIAREVHGPVICGAGTFCATPTTSTAPSKAVREASRPRIHVFLATSAIHRELKLKMAKGEEIKSPPVPSKASSGPRAYVEDVEFSPEDAARTRNSTSSPKSSRAHTSRPGATTINITRHGRLRGPGASTRRCSRELYRAGARRCAMCVVSVHCHDDLGLAVANSLAGMQAGCRQVECTVNGIGERAGNAALEELVMALNTCAATTSGRHTRIDTRPPGADLRACCRASPA